MFKQREIDCVYIKKDSKSNQVRYRYLRYVNRLYSCGKSLLDIISEPFTTWMMVSEERQGHAESVYVTS